MDYSRLNAIGAGEALFTQRSVRRFRPDPIPMEDIHLIMEAAVRAPNGGNRQLARFLVLTDRRVVREMGALYYEAWWAKRRDEKGWTKPEDIPLDDRNYRSAMQLADEIGDVPAMVLAWGLPGAAPNSVIPAVQNLMLAARALGIGSVPTTLHPQVMDRVHALLRVPGDVSFHFLVPLGYPRAGAGFGGSRRQPTSRTTYLDRWGAAVPWT